MNVQLFLAHVNTSTTLDPAAIISGSLLCWGAVDVSGLKFFRGSTTPIGDATRQPGQFTYRDQLRAILSTGHPPHHTSSLRARPYSRSFSSLGTASKAGHVVYFEYYHDDCIHDAVKKE